MAALRQFRTTVQGRRVGIATALSVGLLSSAADSPHLSLHPTVVSLGGRATVLVDGWRRSTLEVALDGATDSSGHTLGWRRAKRHGSGWSAELPQPGQRGIYPVLLRERAGAPVIRSRVWLFRVFRRDALREPTLATPVAVVRWWVRTRPRGRIAALRPWRLPLTDKRDPMLHRLFVVAYNPAGRPGVANRLGMFVTAVRDGYGGRWRLLEATVQP